MIVTKSFAARKRQHGQLTDKRDEILTPLCMERRSEVKVEILKMSEFM